MAGVAAPCSALRRRWAGTRYEEKPASAPTSPSPPTVAQVLRRVSRGEGGLEAGPPVCWVRCAGAAPASPQRTCAEVIAGSRYVSSWVAELGFSGTPHHPQGTWQVAYAWLGAWLPLSARQVWGGGDSATLIRVHRSACAAVCLVVDLAPPRGCTLSRCSLPPRYLVGWWPRQTVPASGGSPSLLKAATDAACTARAGLSSPLHRTIAPPIAPFTEVIHHPSTPPFRHWRRWVPRDNYHPLAPHTTPKILANSPKSGEQVTTTYLRGRLNGLACLLSSSSGRRSIDR